MSQIPDSNPMTLRAYAARRGVSAMTISRAVKKGRLKASVKFDEKGTPRICDADLADVEWEANTDYTDAPQRAAAATVEAVRARVAPPPAPTVPEFSDEPKISSDPEAVTMGGASTVEKFWKAKHAELKFKEAAGELVPAHDVAQRLVTVFTQCKTRLLGIPSAARQAIPELTVAQVAKIEELIRVALEDLAAEGEAV